MHYVLLWKGMELFETSASWKYVKDDGSSQEEFLFRSKFGLQGSSQYFLRIQCHAWLVMVTSYYAEEPKNGRASSSQLVPRRHFMGLPSLQVFQSDMGGVLCLKPVM